MKIKFIDKESASSIIPEKDPYLSNFSNFDIQSRLGIIEEAKLYDLSQFLSHQTLDWKENEIKTIEKVFSELEQAYSSYKKNFPEAIELIKTTGREEADSAYTRKNRIYIPISMLEWSYNELKELIAHELFHVFSNINPKIRNDWYAKLGFIACPELQIPEAYQELYITNPDTIGKNCYLPFIKKGNSMKGVSFLYSESPYRGGYFFQYMRFAFLIAEVTPTSCKALYDGNQIRFTKVPQSLYNLCAEIDPYNNQHRLHPEEILAYYWSLLPFSDSELSFNKRTFLHKISEKIS